MSRILADRMMLDLQSVILAMMDAAEAYQSGDKKTRKQADEMLVRLQDDIARIKREYGMMDSFRNYYGSDISATTLAAPLEQLRRGDVSEALAKLESLYSQLVEEFSGARRKRVLEAQPG